MLAQCQYEFYVDAMFRDLIHSQFLRLQVTFKFLDKITRASFCVQWYTDKNIDVAMYYSPA